MQISSIEDFSYDSDYNSLLNTGECNDKEVSYPISFSDREARIQDIYRSVAFTHMADVVGATVTGDVGASIGVDSEGNGTASVDVNLYIKEEEEDDDNSSNEDNSDHDWQLRMQGELNSNGDGSAELEVRYKF